MIDNVEQGNLHKLLDPDGSNREFWIPRYQRAYSWTQQNWDALFDDITAEDEGYFLGTIICVPKLTGSVLHDIKSLELVDGQQRLTTLSILLAAIHSQYLALRKTSELQGVAVNDEVRSRFLKIKEYLKRDDASRLRLQKTDNNDHWFDWVVQASLSEEKLLKPKIGGNENIYRAWKHFGKRIKTLIESPQEEENLPGTTEIERLIALLRKVNQTVLIIVAVTTHANAYVLFESLNNRGKALTSTDLIKNVALSRADEQGKDVDDIGDRWIEILNRLGEDYRGHERFLRYFYLSIRAKDKIPKYLTKTKLIPVYTDLVKADLQELMDQLDEGSTAYARVIGVEEYTRGHSLDKHLSRLAKLGANQHEMLMLKLMYTHDSLGLSDDLLAEIAEFLVHFFVRRNIMNNPAANYLHRQLIEIIDSLDGMMGREVVDFVKRHLRNISESDDDFARVLKNDAAYEQFRDSVRFLLFEIAEDSFTNESWQNLWETAKNKSLWSLEHVAPQKPLKNSKWKALFKDPETGEDGYHEHVHRLGNLTITRYNSELGTLEFEEKKNRTDSKGNQIGFNNNLSLNEEIVNKDRWGPEEISARTQVLVGKVLAKYPIF